YTISTPFRLCAPCGAERKPQKGITAEMAIYHLSMKIISRNSGLTEPARRVADLLNIVLPDNATSYTLRDIIEALPKDSNA
ncbi:hypothetical protein MRT09_25455, partial [Escherichia coli]|nr:hypothetical protein [Escherichia coli]